MSARRKMTLEDWAISAMALGACIVVGAIVMALIALMFQGFWLLLILAIPFILAQLLLEGAVRGLWLGGRKLLGFPPKQDPPPPEPDLTVPWLRANSGWIGIVIGAAAAGIFGDIWRVFP